MDVIEYYYGMMLVIVLELMIKLIVMVVLGLFVYLWFNDCIDVVIEFVYILFSGLLLVGFIL